MNNGTKSNVTHVTSGVTQGTVLGHILFLIYVSDIGENIDAIKKIYVDDTKVKKGIKSEEDVESLQADLNKLYDWAKTNNMVFNGTKPHKLHTVLPPKDRLKTSIATNG